jgi:hypothetical protein
MAVWRKCRLYSTVGILGALFRLGGRLTRLLPVFDSLDIPDLEAVDVQANASPILYDDSTDRLLVLRQDVSASVARLAVARTIQDFRDRAAREPAVLQPKLDEPSHQRVHARRIVSPSRRRLSIR